LRKSETKITILHTPTNRVKKFNYENSKVDYKSSTIYTQMSPPVTKFVIKILFSQLRTIIKSFHEGEKRGDKNKWKIQNYSQQQPRL